MARKPGVHFELMGLDEIQKYFEDMGAVPQKSVRRSAKAGAKEIVKTIRNSPTLPYSYGTMMRSITDKVEEKKKKGYRNRTGKSAFQITFDRAYNDQLQYKVKGLPGSRGSRNPKNIYYYPASMEFGFMTKVGGNKGYKTGIPKHIPGRHFMLKGGIEAEGRAQDRMLTILSDEIDKIENRPPRKKEV